MLLLCINEGKPAKGNTPPTKGIVYKLLGKKNDKQRNRTGNTWYKISDETNQIHCPSLFEELPDDFLINIQLNKIAEELVSVIVNS